MGVSKGGCPSPHLPMISHLRQINNPCSFMYNYTRCSHIFTLSLTSVNALGHDDLFIHLTRLNENPYLGGATHPVSSYGGLSHIIHRSEPFFAGKTTLWRPSFTWGIFRI